MSLGQQFPPYDSNLSHKICSDCTTLRAQLEEAMKQINDLGCQLSASSTARLQMESERDEAIRKLNECEDCAKNLPTVGQERDIARQERDQQAKSAAILIEALRQSSERYRLALITITQQSICDCEDEEKGLNMCPHEIAAAALDQKGGRDADSLSRP